MYRDISTKGGVHFKVDKIDRFAILHHPGSIASTFAISIPSTTTIDSSKRDSILQSQGGVRKISPGGIKMVDRKPK